MNEKQMEDYGEYENSFLEKYKIWVLHKNIILSLKTTRKSMNIILLKCLKWNNKKGSTHQLTGNKKMEK